MSEDREIEPDSADAAPAAYFASSPRHVEDLLVTELEALGVLHARQTAGGVTFAGTLHDAYRVCLWSRLASRVVVAIARVPAATADALYDAALNIDWEAHLAPGRCFAVRCTLSRSPIRHSQFAALRVKDAIVDRLRSPDGDRPSVQTEQPDVQFHVHVDGEQATLGIDLSGTPLHRRGYRVHGLAAPLKENVAAAVLLRAGWPALAASGGALLDPMCGSGTLCIEAALLACDIAPGLDRDYWGFTGWRGHEPATWEALMTEARRRREAGIRRAPVIRGSDSDPAAVRAAADNVARARLEGVVEISRYALADCSPPAGTVSGLVVTNPPYGVRLGETGDVAPLYTQLGVVLRQRFNGWRASVLTGEPGLGRLTRLRARQIHVLYNGPIECRLLHFDIEPQWFLAPARGPRPLEAAARSAGAAMLANRLRKNARHLRSWLRREGVACYRLYDADLPEYAVAVDIYQNERRLVHVQEYEAPRSIDRSRARLRLREALGVIRDELKLEEDQIFFKQRRVQHGAAQYQKLGESGQLHVVREGAYRFLVNMEDYLDTGLFLDHRLTRRHIAANAGSVDFLNLFSYTGTATVYAAGAGAATTTSVDLSRTYLDWARRNMTLNGFDGAQHRFERADCLQWLSGAAPEHRYGLVFLDPPSFSSSKRMRGTLDVQRDHVGLVHAAARLLTPDGLLLLSTNLRGFELDTQALSAFAIRDISRATLPRDFARNPRIHRCFEIRLS